MCRNDCPMKRDLSVDSDVVTPDPCKRKLFHTKDCLLNWKKQISDQWVGMLGHLNAFVMFLFGGPDQLAPRPWYYILARNSGFTGASLKLTCKIWRHYLNLIHFKTFCAIEHRTPSMSPHWLLARQGLSFFQPLGQKSSSGWNNTLVSFCVQWFGNNETEQTSGGSAHDWCRDQGFCPLEGKNHWVYLMTSRNIICQACKIDAISQQKIFEAISYNHESQRFIFSCQSKDLSLSLTPGSSDPEENWQQPCPQTDGPSCFCFAGGF